VQGRSPQALLAPSDGEIDGAVGGGVSKNGGSGAIDTIIYTITIDTITIDTITIDTTTINRLVRFRFRFQFWCFLASS